MTTIKFIDDVENEIEAVASDLDAREKIRAGVSDAVQIAKEMAREAHSRVDAKMNHTWPRQKRRAWRNDQLLNDYFGDKATVVQIRAVRRRINRARRRLNADKLRIRLLPQKRGTKSSTNGHNKGGPLSPRTFVLFPSWFGISGREERAAIVFHELLHDWHIDHKLNGRTVRGNIEAQRLADANPGKARRNPENYEHFALALRRLNHSTLSELGAFRAGPKPPTRAGGPDRGPRRIPNRDDPQRTRPAPAGRRPRPGAFTP